jgi:hypothetical protein
MSDYIHHINWLSDYKNARRIAVYWAKIALENRAAGIPWEIAAKHSHDATRYALLIS